MLVFLVPGSLKMDIEISKACTSLGVPAEQDVSMQLLLQDWAYWSAILSLTMKVVNSPFATVNKLPVKCLLV